MRWVCYCHERPQGGGVCRCGCTLQAVEETLLAPGMPPSGTHEYHFALVFRAIHYTLVNTDFLNYLPFPQSTTHRRFFFVLLVLAVHAAFHQSFPSHWHIERYPSCLPRLLGSDQVNYPSLRYLQQQTPTQYSKSRSPSRISGLVLPLGEPSVTPRIEREDGRGPTTA